MAWLLPGPSYDSWGALGSVPITSDQSPALGCFHQLPAPPTKVVTQAVLFSLPAPLSFPSPTPNSFGPARSSHAGHDAPTQESKLTGSQKGNKSAYPRTVHDGRQSQRSGHAFPVRPWCLSQRHTAGYSLSEFKVQQQSQTVDS